MIIIISPVIRNNLDIGFRFTAKNNPEVQINKKFIMVPREGRPFFKE